MTTEPDRQEKTAAVWFAGLMTLAMGGAGLLVAALAVGIERAWSGGEVERDRSRERRRGWLDEQRSWLDADHKQRVARARARQDWLDAGGDVAAKPADPSRGHRFGNWFRRLFANVAIAASDFKNGFRDGWAAADKTRRNGGSFSDVAATRPDTPTETVCSNCKRPGVPIAEGGLCGDCRDAYRPKPATPAAGVQGGAARERDPGSRPEPAGSAISPTQEQIQAEPDDHSRIKTPAKFGTSHTDTKENPMTQSTTPIAAQQAPATESNATMLRAKLTAAKTTLGRMADLTDQLAKERATLDGQVRDSEEFATATGQSTQARHALDEASAVSARMGENLGEFSQGAVSAEEQMGQAADGLRVAEQAEDSLRATGADGRAVAPAGANA